MLRYPLYALSGGYSLQLFSTLPSTWIVVAVVLLAAVGTAHRRSRPVAVAMLGFAWMWHAASGQLADKLAVDDQSRSLTIVAEIIDFPKVNATSIRLLVAPVSAAGLPERIRLAGVAESAVRLPERIRLSWFMPQRQPVIGEVWQLRVRLKRPRGFANPAGFDFEGWLHRQRIGATGYVVEHRSNVRIQQGPQFTRVNLRRHAVGRIDALLPGGDARAVLWPAW